jgi:hypothetical protein
VIIDAHALLYRVHYSFGFAARLKTRGGQDTSIEYGFINTVSGSTRHGCTRSDAERRWSEGMVCRQSLPFSCPPPSWPSALYLMLLKPR